jgi:hypothetical protein
MALALLEPEDGDDSQSRAFRFEIGHNRRYRFAVGGGERRSRHGIALLAAPVWISPLCGPLPDAALGRGRFEIPEHVFTREDRFVQMISYRNAAMEGPAISRIVESRRGLRNGLPAIAFSAGASGGVLSRPMDYRVRPLANAMFLESFLAMLPSIFPSIVSLLRSIGPALSSENAGQLARAGANPNTISQLTNLISQIVNRQSASAATAPLPAAGASARSQSLSARWQGLSSRSLGHGPYSTAQVLPLLALAPMLMPLLQQVLNPQTIQSVIDAPNRSAQTVINGIMDAARIGLNDPGLDQLLMNMSLSLSGGQSGIAFRRSEQVRLTFDDFIGLQLGGQTKVLFAQGRPLRFPAHLELPTLKDGSRPTLAPAVLQLQVKDHDTLAVVIEKRFDLPPIAVSGPLPVVAELTVAEAEKLSRDKVYLVSLALVWKTRKGQKQGALVTTRMDLVGPSVFDRIDETGPVVDLADPTRFRDYWHRIWSGRLEKDAKRYAVEVTYLTAPAPVGRAENARLDTEARLRQREGSLHTMDGRIKSGMELSLVALNRLLGAIAPDAKPLDADELAALDQPELRERLMLMARKPIALRGRAGEAVAIWAYPAMRLASIILTIPAEIDGNGHVSRLEEKTVTLPMPALLHLIGTCAK